METATPPGKPLSRSVRPPPSGDRIGILRRTELRVIAESALLHSSESGAVLSILSPDWGDIRKDDWQRIAIAALEASKDLAERLAKNEGRLDAIAILLEDDS